MYSRRKRPIYAVATVLTITENFVQFGHAVFETDRHTDKLIAILGTHTGDEVVLPRNGWYHCEPTTGVISGGSGGPDPTFWSGGRTPLHLELEPRLFGPKLRHWGQR